jgi:hypothetical protein
MANTKRHGPAPKYVNQDTRDYLDRCFPGLIPAVVIEEAVREKALREGRLVIQGKRRIATP